MKSLIVLLTACLLLHGGNAQPYPDLTPVIDAGRNVLVEWLTGQKLQDPNPNLVTVAQLVPAIPSVQPVATPYAGLGTLVSGLFGGPAPITLPSPPLGILGNLGSFASGLLGSAVAPPPPPPSGLLGLISNVFGGSPPTPPEPTGILDALGKLASGLINGATTEAGSNILAQLGTAAGSSMVSKLIEGLKAGTESGAGILSTVINRPAPTINTPSISDLIGKVAKLGADAMKIKVATGAKMAATGLEIADTAAQTGSKLIKDAVDLGANIGKDILGGSTDLASTAIQGGTGIAKQSLGFINHIPGVREIMKPVTGTIESVLEGVSGGSSAVLGAAKDIGHTAFDTTKTGSGIGSDLVSGVSKLGLDAGKGALAAGSNMVNSMFDRVVGMFPKKN